MEQVAEFPEAYGKAGAVPPPMPVRPKRIGDSRIIAAKEFTQVANRRGFHLEKSVFTLAAAAIFAFSALSLTGGWTADLRQMSTFGRQAFQPVSIFACVILSLSALISSTGIVMSEAVGKRLDLLRMTPLSLDSIVFGKAAAVFGKAALVAVLLLPILAATQTMGGVSTADVILYLVLTLTDVFFVTALGVYISAGAKSNIDRVVRSGEAVFLWLVLTSFLDVPIYFTSVSFSPIRIWALYVTAKWSVVGVIWNVLFNGGVGLVLLKKAAKRLGAAAGSADIVVHRPHGDSLLTAEDPNVQHLLAGVRNVARRRKKAKAIAAERKWAGTLIGSQILHTSLVAVLLPLAVGVPQVLIFILSAITGRGAWDWRETYPAFVSTTLGAAAALMLLVQSCALLAREKSRHTAEVLAVTTEGGASMLWWKGAAVLASQSVALSLCAAMLVFGGFVGRVHLEMAAINLLGLCALVMLVFATGVSFSLASRSPYEAFAFAAGSVLLAAPLFYILFGRLVGLFPGLPMYASVYRGGAYAVGPVAANPPGGIAALICVFPGMLLVIWRNSFPAGARFALGIGLALVFAGVALIMPFSDESFTPLMLPLVPLMNVIDYQHHEVLRGALVCIAGEFLLAAALLGGAYLNFTPNFLYGARAKD